MKNTYVERLIELNLATVFISTSGALGKFIDMPIPVIIWWRSALAILFLYGFIRLKRHKLTLYSKKDTVVIIISGLLTGAHWITYFYALKLSNVAIGMLSLFCYPVITALLEPFFLKTKLDKVHILLGFLVLFGIFLLAPNFNVESSHIQGIFFGLLSALFYAVRILISKQLVTRYNGTLLMFYQVVVLTIVLVPTLAFMETSSIQTEWPFVLMLAFITTTLGHTMLVHSLKHFSGSTASIISSAQPVFGIIIAYFFLSEIPTSNTFFGGVIILSTVVIESIRSKKAKE